MSRKITATIVAIITRTVEISDDEDIYMVERNLEYEGFYTGECTYQELAYKDFDKVTALVTEIHDD